LDSSQDPSEVYDAGPRISLHAPRHGDIAREANGLTEDDVIIPDNGSIIEIQEGGKKIVKLKEKAPSGIVMVDGFAVGDIQDVVIRDRQMLAQDGISSSLLSSMRKQVTQKSPDIIHEASSTPRVTRTSPPGPYHY